MSFTLDPEVAEALAPFTPPPGSTLPPAGDVAPRIAMLESIFRYADTAHPHTSWPPPTARRSRCAGTPARTPPASPAPPRSTCTAAA